MRTMLTLIIKANITFFCSQQLYRQRVLTLLCSQSRLLLPCSHFGGHRVYHNKNTSLSQTIIYINLSILNATKLFVFDSTFNISIRGHTDWCVCVIQHWRCLWFTHTKYLYLCCSRIGCLAQTGCLEHVLALVGLYTRPPLCVHPCSQSYPW